MGGSVGGLALPVMLLLGLGYLSVAQATTPDAPLLAELLIHGAPLNDRNKSNHVWRERREVTCQLDEYKHKSGAFCCKKCMKGFRKLKDCSEEGQATPCAPCPSGSYTEVENSWTQCMQCETCREGFGQVVISLCTFSSNVVCGCPKGKFKEFAGRDFVCRKCKVCDNGRTLKDCDEKHNTICACNHGFFNIESQCRPCNECLSDGCRLQCPQPVIVPPSEGSPLLLITLVVVLAICLVLMVGFILWRIYFKAASTTYDSVSPHQTEIVHIPEMEVGENCSLYLPGPLVTSLNHEMKENLRAVQCIPALAPQLPDCVNDARSNQLPDDPGVLYIVVDKVPPSRWKEFVRRLGLCDYDIERIELQTRNYREMQYEMLQMWRQRTGATRATLEEISHVLREMNLSGCSEAIQDSLPLRPRESTMS